MDYTKGDKIAITIFLTIFILASWYLQKIFNDFDIWFSIVMTIALGIVIISVWMKKTPPPQSPTMKYIYRWMGWRRKYGSINLKIISILCIIGGIVWIALNKKPLWIGIILIILSPMLWYLSRIEKQRAEEFFEAGKK